VSSAAAGVSARAAGRARQGAFHRIPSEAASGYALISPAFLYALALLAFPLMTVVVYSFWTQSWGEGGVVIDRTPTWANYRTALTEPIYLDLLQRSLRISVTVSVVTVLLAYPVAYFISFYGGRHKGLWLFVITLPFWTSYLLRIMAWKVILGQSGVLNTGLIGLGLIETPLTSLIYNTPAVIVTLAHAWAPFAILPIFVSLEKVDRTLIEAAADLGDGPLRRFLRVTLPLTMPGLLAALLIVMIPTVGDYVTPRLVGGKDGVMISNAIQTQFGRASNWPLGAALAVTTMLAVTLVAAVVAFGMRALSRVLR
jgi:spermidine/putrescine transport system permease protein